MIELVSGVGAGLFGITLFDVIKATGIKNVIKSNLYYLTPIPTIVNAWIDWDKKQQEIARHRSSAYNCRYWVGDRGWVDQAECSLCSPAVHAKAIDLAPVCDCKHEKKLPTVFDQPPRQSNITWLDDPWKVDEDSYEIRDGMGNLIATRNAPKIQENIKVVGRIQGTNLVLIEGRQGLKVWKDWTDVTKNLLESVPLMTETGRIKTYTYASEAL